MFTKGGNVEEAPKDKTEDEVTFEEWLETTVNKGGVLMSGPCWKVPKSSLSELVTD